MCIRDRDRKYREALADFAGRQIVTAHEAYGYLCSAYGLEQVGIDGLSPDQEPNPKRMADIIDFVRENQIRAVFFEELSGCLLYTSWTTQRSWAIRWRR